LVFALGAAGALGYYAWQLRGERHEAQNALQAAHVEVAEVGPLKQRSHELSAALDACKESEAKQSEECKQSAASMVGLQSDLDATRTELEDVRKQREEAAERIAAYKEITARFQEMVDAGRLEVTVKGGQLTVNLSANVLFESGKADLSREGELALMEVAVVFRDFSERKLMVVGHTDDRPLEDAKNSRFKSNWELSTARAVSVVNFLTEAKLSPGNLIAAGKGEHAPVQPNTTPAGRKANRRIELVLMPDLGGIRDMSLDDVSEASGEAAGEAKGAVPAKVPAKAGKSSKRK